MVNLLLVWIELQLIYELEVVHLPILLLDFGKPLELNLMVLLLLLRQLLRLGGDVLTYLDNSLGLIRLGLIRFVTRYGILLFCLLVLTFELIDLLGEFVKLLAIHILDLLVRYLEKVLLASWLLVSILRHYIEI